MGAVIAVGQGDCHVGEVGDVDPPRKTDTNLCITIMRSCSVLVGRAVEEHPSDGQRLAGPAAHHEAVVTMALVSCSTRLKVHPPARVGVSCSTP